MHDQHFANMSELTKAEPSPANASYHAGKEYITLARSSALNQYGIRVYGVETVDEVVRLTKTGWPDGLRRIREALKVIDVPGVASVRRRRVRRNFGDHLDIQRVYAGELDRAWSSTERAVRRGVGRHVVTLLVHVGASWGRDASELFWRGAAAVTLADALERSGRRVRIVGYKATSSLLARGGWGETTTTSFSVKDADQPLDLERAALALALTGTLRVWLFRAECALPMKVSTGLGRPIHVSSGRVTDPNCLPEGLRTLLGTDATIVVDGIKGRDEAQAFLDSTLEGFSDSTATANPLLRRARKGA